nr:cytochrome P450 [Salsipaludibacter albus]
MRPTVAVNWYVGLLAVALARHPHVLDQLRGDPAWRLPVVQEVRRHLPFFPFVAARTRMEVPFGDTTVPDDTRVLLDLYGTNHDPDAWDDPARFEPARFVDRPVGANELVPQGGGDDVAGHRCVGEQLTIRLLEGAAGLLADDFTWRPDFAPVLPRGHLPTLPPGGVVLTDVRARTP